MRSSFQSLLAVCMISVLGACDSQTLPLSGGDGTVSPEAVECGDRAGSGFGDTDGSHRVSLKLEGLPASIPCEAQLRVIVFGYDRLVADVAATPILNLVEPVPEAGAAVLHFDATDFARVAFQSGVQDTLGYYIEVSIDLDGDGVVCGTDLSRDFDVSPLKFYRFEDNDVAAVIRLKDNSGPCG